MAASHRVNGPPSTQNTGTPMERIMWPTMCMENVAGMFMPMPEHMVTSNITQPDMNQAVRYHGQGSPRRRRRRTPHM